LRKLQFDSPNLRGSTGIADIGLMARSNPDSPWSMELGLQGYVGKVQGISGGVRLGYEF
jgi:hypothetical protein